MTSQQVAAVEPEEGHSGPAVEMLDDSQPQCPVVEFSSVAEGAGASLAAVSTAATLSESSLTATSSSSPSARTSEPPVLGAAYNDGMDGEVDEPSSSPSSFELRIGGPRPAALPTAAGTESVLAPISHGITLWRLPTRPGQLPAYVQRNFRLKAMGLVSMQSAILLVIMLLVAHLDVSSWFGSYLFVMMLSTLVFLIMLLALCKSIFPLNYAVLALVTAFTGFTWGVSGELVPAQMHIQVAGIIFIGMTVATATATFGSFWKWEPLDLVLSSVLVGLAVGSVADGLVATAFGIDWVHVNISIAVACVFFAVFSYETGRLLRDCNPDSFMDVVIATDVCLLMAVALPFPYISVLLCVLTCCFYSVEQEDEDETPAAMNAV